MKKTLAALCGAVALTALAGCVYEGRPYHSAYGGAVVYDGYYDNYYGPYYGGYWSGDGYFYYSDAGRRHY
jgi:hypothetical protein